MLFTESLDFQPFYLVQFCRSPSPFSFDFNNTVVSGCECILMYNAICT